MKRFLSILLTAFMCILPLSACSNDGKTTIRLNEVTHSVFYAPLYVAIENGYLAEENIEIELTNGGGADKSMTALLSKTADIALMGPETVIYVQNQGKTDKPMVIGQLTQKDGSFLVSRNEEPNFTIESLRNKEILAGRRGGVPAMTFEYLLYENGMVNNTDYTLNYDVQFNLMTSAFVNGTADYCTVFEPTASEYQSQGIWHIVARVGELSGEIPYTSFIALQSYIDNNSQTIKGFFKGLKKAFDFINQSTDLQVAQAIINQFPATTINSIEVAVKNYRKIDAWKDDLQATQSSFDRLQNIMIYSNELEEKLPFENIVDNTLAKQIFN